MVEIRSIYDTTLDATYLRLEDVAELIRSFGATEGTDVRNRANELADNIEKGERKS